MTNTNKQARKTLVFNYLATPREQRLPLKKFLKGHKMQRRTFCNLEGEYKVEKLVLTKREGQAHQEKLKNTVLDAWDRADGKDPPKRIEGVEIAQISEEERLALARKVYKDAMLSDASAKDKDLAVRMLGMLIEKREDKITVELSADEIARRNLEAERQLREAGYRVEEVQEKPSLLSK